MSVHILRTEIDNVAVEVQMGWDAPMQWFYLVISPRDVNGELYEPIYSNLFEDDPASKDLDYFVEICKNHGIRLPENMINAVKSDSVTGTMNRQVDYTE